MGRSVLQPMAGGEEPVELDFCDFAGSALQYCHRKLQ